jgi:hypothetical protein
MNTPSKFQPSNSSKTARILRKVERKKERHSKPFKFSTFLKIRAVLFEFEGLNFGGALMK